MAELIYFAKFTKFAKVALVWGVGFALLTSFSISSSAFTRRAKDSTYSDDNRSDSAGRDSFQDHDSDRFSSGASGGSSGATLFGGLKELGGGTSGGGRYSNYGALSYVELGSEYGRGRGIERSRTTCPGSGSFQWLFYLSRSCLPMGGSTELFKLLDRSFNKCVASGARAAGISSNAGSFGGKVYHKGIEGDRRHQQTNSLHNVGRAIDIAVIEVNGTVMDFSKASQQKRSGRLGKEYRFFEAFRGCWSSESRNADSACAGRRNTRAGYFGSVGWEDRDHQRHIHISLPVCDQSGFKMANGCEISPLQFVVNLITPSASAAEFNKPDKINVLLSSGARVTGSANFTGEPVAAPVSIQLSIQCEDKSKKVIEDDLQACDFVSFKEDASTKKMILTTLESKFNEKEGNFECGPSSAKVYENPCLKSHRTKESSGQQSEFKN